MPRTTLDIDPGVLRDLRERADRDRKSLGRVASELLATALRKDTPRISQSFTWISGDLGLPRIDLEDDEAVRRALDG